MKLFVLVVCLLFSSVLVSNAQEIKGTYAIKNIKTGMLLRIKDADSTNGTPLVAYAPQNWKCMTWDFESTGENIYQLKNLYTQKTFQPVSEPKDAVDMAEQEIVPNAVNQQYEFLKIEKDIYLIRLKETDLYLTPSDPEGTINSKIILKKKKEGTLQQWNIYLQHPTM